MLPVETFPSEIICAPDDFGAFLKQRHCARYFCHEGSAGKMCQRRLKLFAEASRCFRQGDVVVVPMAKPDYWTATFACEGSAGEFRPSGLVEGLEAISFALLRMVRVSRPLRSSISRASSRVATGSQVFDDAADLDDLFSALRFASLPLDTNRGNHSSPTLTCRHLRGCGQQRASVPAATQNRTI